MIKVDNVEKWPKLTNVNDYAVWKEEFELVVKSEDTRMWYCIIDGYIAPTRRVEGRTKVISYDKMDESEKLMVVMPPRFLRGRGKGPVSGHDHEAGPSHRRTPSITMSTSPQEPWRLYIEPGRRSVSLSSSPSYQHSFGPHSENEPNNQPPAFIPLQRSNSHHSFGDPTPVFQSRFNPANLLPEPVGFNPLGPGDHFLGENDMDEDTDPVEPASGTPNHPIEISDGSSFHGSPYSGPDSFMEKFNQYDWYFTPSEHSHHQKHQDPSVGQQFVAVTPLPPQPVEQQPPPEPPRRRRSNARMSVRGGVRISTPQPSSGSHYPPLQEEEDPHMAAYNPFEQPAHTHYNYNYSYVEVDPYQVARDYNALHPEGPYGGPWTTGYPTYGYQHQPPPPPVYQPPQPQIQQEVLERLNQVEQEVREDRRERQGFFKGLSDLLKGKSKRRGH
ncbi:extensin-like [Helianthus annuus]|uniref:extensin-like n=1 Tax=Helianthus annuus TaxID=4232 RepID=UPI0016531684|nr:extensin-like [Helianthus annuus]